MKKMIRLVQKSRKKLSMKKVGSSWLKILSPYYSQDNIEVSSIQSHWVYYY